MAITVTGLSELVKDLRKFGKDSERMVKTELENSGTKIELDAINAAPSRIDGARTLDGTETLDGAILNIKQRIDKIVSDGGLTVKVGIQGTQDIDAYIEFGTGLNFIDIVSARPQDYTPEILNVARQFYKNGRGTLTGTPYLFPSFFNETPRLLDRLSRELNTLANNF